MTALWFCKKIACFLDRILAFYAWISSEMFCDHKFTDILRSVIFPNNWLSISEQCFSLVNNPSKIEWSVCSSSMYTLLKCNAFDAQWFVLEARFQKYENSPTEKINKANEFSMKIISIKRYFSPHQQLVILTGSFWFQ